jgi:two-component system chemotaxis response regulator CheY
MARILIAEDEDSLANLYRALLVRYGHQVCGVVTSGDEAVRLYRTLEPHPDLVLMDHRLERESGIEAMREILRTDPKAKIIFASADDSIMEDAIEQGAADYIGKPFSMQELIEVVNRCLDSGDAA